MIRFNNFNNIFGNTNSIYNSLSQLNSVRRGSYGKILKAYYAKDNTASVSKNTAGKTGSKNTAGKTGSKNTRYDYPLYSANAGLDEIRTQTDKLTKSAGKLTDSSRNGLFADKARSVFGSGGSFARSVSSYSARLGSAAKQQSLQTANNTGIYGRYGTYNTNSYGTGNYNWWY